MELMEEESRGSPLVTEIKSHLDGGQGSQHRPLTTFPRLFIPPSISISYPGHSATPPAFPSFPTFNPATGFCSEDIITVEEDYESTEKYSKATMFDILRCNDISDVLNDEILYIIASYAEGRIVRCAECKDFEANIQCIAEIDERFKGHLQDIWVYPIFGDENVDRFINLSGLLLPENLLELRSALSVGDKYAVLCKVCRFGKYCTNTSLDSSGVGEDLLAVEDVRHSNCEGDQRDGVSSNGTHGL